MKQQKQTPLWHVETYGKGCLALTITIPMLRSVNRKYGVNTQAAGGQRLYITPAYRAQEAKAIEDIGKLVCAARWQVAETDHYAIIYRFTFPLPKTLKTLTGDIHNPLKPLSDALTKGGALYDDNNTILEVIEKDNTPEKYHWATITIYRFLDGHIPALPIPELLSLLLQRLYTERKTA